VSRAYTGHTRGYTEPANLLQRFCESPLRDSAALSRYLQTSSHFPAAFRRGESPETICQNFELLQLEEVYGAIAYYLANQPDIDDYLIRQNEKWAEVKRNAEPLLADLRERLIHARDELHTARPS